MNRYVIVNFDCLCCCGSDVFNFGVFEKIEDAKKRVRWLEENIEDMKSRQTALSIIDLNTISKINEDGSIDYKGFEE